MTSSHLPSTSSAGSSESPAAPQADTSPQGGPAGRETGNWVPIRSLLPRHRNRISEHLRTLSTADRYLRFGYIASDDQIDRYAQALDFSRDEVFGIFNRRLKLIAVGHLAYAPTPQRKDAPAMVEFGVSVLASARGRGYGKHLFDHAALHARNRGIDTLFIQALTDNQAMLSIARRSGATIERDGSESQAWLKLPPANLTTHLGEIFEHQAAELNYGMKRRVAAIDRWLQRTRLRSPV